MATLLEELSQLISALDENEIEYAVCGGLALTIHGFVRASYGFDILIQADSIKKACEIARRNGYKKSEFSKSFEKSSVEIRCVSKIDEDGEILPLKFLLVNPKVEDVWETRGKLIWQDKNLTVVSREGLIKMKTLAGRAKDLIDIDRIENEED